MERGETDDVRGREDPMFETADGDRYVEIHHIVPLADGGEDIIENVVNLCPAHHREVHAGINKQKLTMQLKSLRTAERQDQALQL